MSLVSTAQKSVEQITTSQPFQTGVSSVTTQLNSFFGIPPGSGGGAAAGPAHDGLARQPMMGGGQYSAVQPPVMEGEGSWGWGEEPAPIAAVATAPVAYTSVQGGRPGAGGFAGFDVEDEGSEETAGLLGGGALGGSSSSGLTLGAGRGATPVKRGKIGLGAKPLGASAAAPASDAAGGDDWGKWES